MNSRFERLLLKAHDLLETEDNEKAWPFIAEALNCDMDNAQALYLAGIFFRRKGHPGVAANLLRRSVAMNPKPSSAWMYFGACLHDMHAFEPAMDVWQFVRQNTPETASLWRNIAATLVQTAKFKESVEACDKCLTMDKAPPSVRAIRSLASLGLGNWVEGFRDYKYLYGDVIQVRQYGKPPAPDWEGDKGRILIVQGDQGVGDEIMYASIIPDVIKDCKAVIYDCHPKMESVFRRSFPDVQVEGTRKKSVVGWLDLLNPPPQINPENEWDNVRKVHVSSLGCFYRQKDADFPRTPYLKPSAVLRDKWRAVLSSLPRPYVGLTWVGGSVVTGRESRSIDLEEWLPLIERGGTFVDLSYHDSKAEVEAFNKRHPSTPVHHLEVDQNDYDDTLALIAELDLVASVTTTAVHACGSIGKMCLVLVNKNVEWRIAPQDKQGMIWYEPDCIQTYRQRRSDLDFTQQIYDIAHDFDAYLEEQGIPARKHELYRAVADHDRSGPAPAPGVHDLPEQHHPAGVAPGADHPAHPAPATHF